VWSFAERAAHTECKLDDFVHWGSGARFLQRDAIFDLAGKRMIKVRIRISDDTGDFAVIVCAESLRRAAQSVKERYPDSTVEIAFPIESNHFFSAEPHHGEHVDLEAK
jgi:hypothetical protein